MNVGLCDTVLSMPTPVNGETWHKIEAAISKALW